MKLIDVKHDKRLVELGTCDMCFSLHHVDCPTLIFEDEHGQFEIEAYDFDYGRHIDYFDKIDNVIDFAAFIASRDDITRPKQYEFDTDWLAKLTREYYTYEES